MITECRTSLFSGGDTCIAWVATHLRYDLLTPVMRFISELGEVGGILFTISLIYWLWNKRYGKYLCYGLFTAILINLWLKGLVRECRPPSQFWLEDVESYSFPSGHAQIGVYLWLGLAYYLRKSWLSPLCLAIGIMISISRVYLGVHYPQDIIAGALLGFGVLLLILWCEKKDFQLLSKFSLWQQVFILLAILSCYELMVYDPRGNDVATIASAFGFWLGCQYETKLQFQPVKRPLSVLSQLFIGCSGILLFWKGGNWLTDQVSSHFTVTIEYIQYFLLGFWIAFGAPALNLRLGFVKQQASVIN
ncbi:MAG: phosphatase PAP2 family protein [Proteobacteria bacterium]|nr:phosphatase PAP2 family protein [Pseudomonadota bacterium]